MQILGLFFAMILRAVSSNARRTGYDSDDDYLAPRSNGRQPLLNRQVNQSNPATTPGSTADNRPVRNDAWSTRMREKVLIPCLASCPKLSVTTRFLHSCTHHLLVLICQDQKICLKEKDMAYLALSLYVLASFGFNHSCEKTSVTQGYTKHLIPNSWNSVQRRPCVRWSDVILDRVTILFSWTFSASQGEFGPIDSQEFCVTIGDVTGMFDDHSGGSLSSFLFFVIFLGSRFSY